MPRQIEVSEVLKMPPGEKLQSLRGVVQGVFPPKTGEGQRGPWSFQNIILRDCREGSSESVEVKFWNLDTPISPSSKGQILFIAPPESGRYKLETEENEYTPKGDVHKVTKFGVVADGCSLAFVRGGDQVAAKKPAPAQQSTAAAQPAQPADEVGEAFTRAKRLLLGKANSLVLCLEGVDYIERAYRKLLEARLSEGRTPEQVKSLMPPLMDWTAKVELIKTLSVIGDKCGAFDNLPSVNLERQGEQK